MKEENETDILHEEITSATIDSDVERVEELKERYVTGELNEAGSEEKLESQMDGKTYGDIMVVDSIPDQIWMQSTDQEPPDPVLFDPVEDEHHLPIKPIGGMWTSSYTPDDDYRTDWIRWCAHNSFISGREMWLMTPKDDLTVAVVDDMDDLWAIVNRYECDLYKGREVRDTMYPIDFHQMMQDGFDAIRLTKEGQWNTRMPGIENPDLYGWDSECVLSFRWIWDDWEYFGRCERERLY